jgi:hypothetical protein
MGKIYFSLHEANELVQKLKPKINRILSLSDELDLLDNTKIEFDDENMENYMLEVELNKNFHEKNLELYTLIGEIIGEGAIVRDVEKIEIDFYSKLGDRDIVFCYMPSEEKIEHWHYPDEDYNLRRSVKEIEKKYYEKLNNFK